MKKWTNVAPVVDELRWRTLEKALTEAGCANEFIPWTVPPDGEIKIEALQEFDHVRLSTRLAPQIVKQLRVQSSWTTLLGVVDGMNKTDRGWWPLCALHESFVQQLILLGQDLDMRASVLIAGAGGAARIAIAAFFRAGFRHFLVTNFDSVEAQKMIGEIQRRFFDLTIQWVPMERIVLLPGESAVLVNCTPTVEENALLVELSYLNFLKRPGFLFDMNATGKKSSLMAEADDAGVRVIEGIELAARTDVTWANWGFQTQLDFSKYFERLKAAHGIVAPAP